MSSMDDWLAAAARELGLDPADIDRTLILDLARDVAHGVARPAAPLTAYLLGVAKGRGADETAAAARITALATAWTDAAERAPGPHG